MKDLLALLSGSAGSVGIAVLLGSVVGMPPMISVLNGAVGIPTTVSVRTVEQRATTSQCGR